MKLNKLWGSIRTTKEERIALMERFFERRTGYNSYFGVASAVLRGAEFLSLILLILYLIVSALGNLGGITYENAEYMFRNFAMKLEENRNAVTELIYNPDSGMSAALCGKGFCVCGNTGISVFSATGRKTCSDSFDFFSPVLRASGKYIAVFENGGTEYYIYNSYSRVYTGSTDCPIRNISMSERGVYAVLSESGDYLSVITLYDRDFTPVSVIRKDAYVVAAELNAEGTRLLLTSVSTDDSGGFCSVTEEVTVGEDSFTPVAESRGLFPLYGFFTPEGIGTVYTDRVVFFPDAGSSRTCTFDGREPVSIHVSEGYVTLVLRHPDKPAAAPVLMICAPDGTSRACEPAGPVYSVTSFADRAWILGPEGISTFAAGDLSAPEDPGKPFGTGSVLLAPDGDTLYLAGKSAAYFLGEQ